MTIINDNEIRIAAIKRSGHHAIINWILLNVSGPKYFLNNCKPNRSPYINLRKADSLLFDIDIRNEKCGKFKKKKYLFYNFESQFLEDIYSSQFLSNIEKWVGKSQSVKNILVLRDPFNNFASMYKWAKHGKKWVPSIGEIEHLPVLWKAYAKEFLGITSFVPAQKIFVKFNTWFTDPQYRNDLASEIGLTTTNRGLNEVAKWGPNTWGDSFDNMNFDGKADKMNVLHRWAVFKDDRLFVSLFKDTELIALSEKIFGHIPQTEVLYD